MSDPLYTSQPDEQPLARASDFLAQWTSTPDEEHREKWSKIASYERLEGTEIGDKLMRKFPGWPQAKFMNRVGFRVLGTGCETWRGKRKFPSVVYVSPDGYTRGRTFEYKLQHRQKLGRYSYNFHTVFEDGVELSTHSLPRMPFPNSKLYQSYAGTGSFEEDWKAHQLKVQLHIQRSRPVRIEDFDDISMVTRYHYARVISAKANWVMWPEWVHKLMIAAVFLVTCIILFTFKYLTR